jgi:hypothetical protein
MQNMGIYPSEKQEQERAQTNSDGNKFSGPYY